MDLFQTLFDNNTIKYSPINDGELVDNKPTDIPVKVTTQNMKVTTETKKKNTMKDILTNTDKILCLKNKCYKWIISDRGSMLTLYRREQLLSQSNFHGFWNDNVIYYMNDGHTVAILYDGEYKIFLNNYRYSIGNPEWIDKKTD